MSDHPHDTPDTHERTDADASVHSRTHDDREPDHTHADGTTHAHDHAPGHEQDDDNDHAEKKGFFARLFGSR